MRGGAKQPERGPCCYWHAESFSEHITEVNLRINVSFAGHLAKPSNGLRAALFHSFALKEIAAEVALRPGVSLLGRLAIPSRCLGVVFFKVFWLRPSMVPRLHCAEVCPLLDCARPPSTVTGPV